MQKYDAIVVGAGLGGLSSACRLAKAGKKVLLIEQHNLPGGVASANKTGELADVENDVAIVYGPSCTYILCVMSDGVAPGIAQSNIIDISSTVYYALNG